MPRNFSPSLAAVAVLLLATFCTSVAQAQASRPRTAEEDFMENLVEALQAAAQLHAGMKELSANIESARRDYFQAAAGSPAQAKARAKFARLLSAKDYLYSDVLLSRGLARELRGELEVDFVDHGIPEAARPAYVDWIRGVRKSLGAANDDSFLVITAAPLRQAMEANATLYTTYCRIRDQAEIDGWNQRLARAEAQKHVHGMSRIDLKSLPPALKAVFDDEPVFRGWQGMGRVYVNANGTRYLLAMPDESGENFREYLFDEKGATAHFEEPKSQQDAAARYAPCQAKAKSLKLKPPYFTWYADKCQFGPAIPSDEEVAQWQRDGEELERLQASQIPPPDDKRANAELALKNKRCMESVGSNVWPTHPLLVPRCMSSYQFTAEDQELLKKMVAMMR